MKLGQIDFPKQLINSLRDGRLVVFAGAGVSKGKPACLHDFKELTQIVAEGTGKSIKENEPEDHFLGKLQHAQINVHERAAGALSLEGSKPTDLHRSLLRLYSEVKQVRIVTTNFDQLFEQAALELFAETPEVFRAPALPLGNEFYGIVHVHGSLVRPNETVLTDADFGRAYLTQGWARRFLVDVFRNFDVLFVGYSHNDVIVSYLARALPGSDLGHRFVITDCNDDLDRWNVLGTEPITYPKQNSDDFNCLYDGVQRLSDLVNRSILDWKYELTNFASKPPPIDEEAVGLIEHAMETLEKTRFITGTAKSKEWIKWFDERKIFDALFLPNELSQRDIEITRWLAENFAARCSHDVFLLIGNHSGQLNSQFWWSLGREIGKGKSEIDDKTLSRWVSILLVRAPSNPDHHVLLWLGERCQELDLYRDVLKVFETMSRFRLNIKPGYSWSNDELDDNQPLQIEIQFIADYYALNKLWQKCLKPNIGIMPEAILARTVNNLEEQYLALKAWQKANRKGDNISWGRSAIEPHGQDEFPEIVDVLIDAARDALEWLALNQSKTGLAWIERLISSDVPLLRRLAVHAITEHSAMNADDRINWLLGRIGLTDYTCHHEIYRLLALQYPHTTMDVRKAVIDSVLAYTWPEEEAEKKETREARYQFDWLNWLHKAAPECALVQNALDPIRAHHPEFQMGNYPDFIHWMEAGQEQPSNVWSTEQLLSKRPAEWIPELLALDQEALVSAICDATKQKIDWGIEFANGLDSANEWNSSLWAGLLRAWSATDLGQGGLQAVLGIIENDRLFPNFQHDIASLLRSLIKSGENKNTSKFLSRTDHIARNLWLHLDHSEQPEEKQDWLLAAINHPAGILAEYWLSSISIWRKTQDPRPKALDSEYRCVLNQIVSQQSLTGTLGKSVLASQFAFFLSVDDEWTLDKLRPLFDETDHVTDFQSAWDGFLVWGRLNPEVAETMEDSFYNAIKRLDIDLPGRKNRFIEYFTAVLCLYAEDPINVGIPYLFKYADVETREIFASSIRRQLHRNSESQQKEWWDRWLKKYWNNRLQNVPLPLEDGEIETMLAWLPHLTSVFSEAVEIAILMPNAQLQNSLFVYELIKSDLINTFPTESAKLVIYLGDLDTQLHFWHNGAELFDELINSDIDLALIQKLKELKARLGL